MRLRFNCLCVCACALLACIVSNTVRGGQDFIADTAPPVYAGKILAIAVDTSGNRYMAGEFFNANYDFNPGIGGDIRVAKGIRDAFVTRINADGTYGWTETFGGSGDDSAAGIAVSGTTVYVTGYFSGTDAGFNGLGAIPALGGTDCFILALDSATGAPLTSFNSTGFQRFGGTGLDVGAGIAVSGNTLFVCGTFNSNNAGFGTLGTIATSGSDDAFVISLDATTGAPNTTFNSKGAQIFGGPNNLDSAFAVVTIGTFVYVAGSYASTGVGIGGFGSIGAQNNSRDAFVMALDTATGAAKTSFRGNGVLTLVGQQNDQFVALAVDSKTLYIGGDFLSPTVATAGGASTLATNSGSNATDGIILAVDPGTGALKTAFHSNGAQTFGGNGTQTITGLAIGPTTLYAQGVSNGLNAGVGGLGTLPTAGLRDSVVLALDPNTGAPVTSFNGSGLQSFGGTDDETPSAIALSGNIVYAAGSFGSNDATVGGAGGAGPFAHGFFGGYVLPLNAATGQFIGNAPPSITDFTTLDNPALINSPVNYSLSATDTDSAVLYYSIDFADGTPPATGTLQPGVAITVSHAFAVGGNFTVVATVDDRLRSTTASYAQSIPPPNSGAANVKNVADGSPAVTNPVDGLAISFMGSNGGVVQLGINQNLPAARRDTLNYTTRWGDVVGKETVGPGTRPLHSYTQHGIFVALCTSTNPVTGDLVGMGRRTIVISSKETGEVLPSIRSNGALAYAIGDPPVTTIATRAVKGRFVFLADKDDTVSYSGTIQLPPGLDPYQPHEFSMGIGNIVVATTLDERGRGETPGTPAILKRLKLTIRGVRREQLTKGGETARVDMQMTTAGLIAAGFDTEGITNRANDVGPRQTAPREIQIALLLEGVAYQGSIPVQFGISRNAQVGTITGRR